MTQRKHSARKDANRSHNQSWQRSLPAQSLCWLSSLSLMSSGLVLAQTESAIDNIVPTENTPKTASESPQVEFSSRRTRLKQRLQRDVASQSAEPARKVRNQQNSEAATVPVVRKLRAKVAESRRNPVVTPSDRSEKKQVEVTSQPSVQNRAEKPVVRIAPNKLPALAQPSQPVNIDNTDSKTKDYNNAYIDPTNYNTANTNPNESANSIPSSVILTNRSNGCRAVIGTGDNISGNCVNTPITPSLAERLAISRSDRTSATAPSWIRKSQSDVASAIPTKRTATRENNSGWRASRIAAASDVPTSENNRSVNRIINTGNLVASSNKNTYHPNRFIPAPSSFIPQDTTLSATPTGSAGTLPSPMTAANVTPRASKVAYNIPLESTLPRVNYTGGLAYNPSGFIFPVSVPSPITSIFGWRTHPITGDRRFHSGTDIGAAMGTPVLAAYTGQIEVADFVGGYGLTVVVNHSNALQTLYGHMSQIYVQPGQWVQQGTVIGLVGSTGNSTGPHLHFEVRQLTPNGWVATDPGVHLQYALAQLMQSIQTARLPQVPQQPSN
ncbi:M23 family metallopeptidase [Calothrix sp. UHCC 0171]|uniref:M23 family metallopeptidase n=1 Tax=Calothrix sp. UHCC 0171 TaxID=3110245 RepID=UPI002B21B12C|nr:M23 family metallopeptidase [Calothrix sp. UHCC 0171]MEA5572669.1 M23 family metallopeptidase [Calothrix sp. UHCC 0171]